MEYCEKEKKYLPFERFKKGENDTRNDTRARHTNPMKYNLTLARPNDDRTSVRFISYINGRRVVLGTGVSVDPKEWDKKRQRLKANNKDLAALQTELDNAVQAIVNAANQLTVLDGVELTPESLRDAVKRMKDGRSGVAEKVLTFNQWVADFIKDTAEGGRTNQKGQAIGERTVAKYKTVQNLLEKFSKKVWGRAIRFDEIDATFLDKYRKFRAETGVGVNTIAKDIAVLKTWVKESYHRGVHTSRLWEASHFKVKEVRVTKPHLTLEELAMIEAAKLPTRTHYGREITAIHAVRDLFLLGCWTGARISDIKRFPEIVAEAWKANGNKCPDELTFIQHKTKEAVTVPVLPAARRIIEKHKGKLPKPPNEQKMNATVKELVRVAGIDRTFEQASTDFYDTKTKRLNVWEEVTNHTARRTFATNVYQLGVMSLGELMSLTGHESESSLMTYLNVTRLDVSKKASEKLRAAFEG